MQELGCKCLCLADQPTIDRSKVQSIDPSIHPLVMYLVMLWCWYMIHHACASFRPYIPHQPWHHTQIDSFLDIDLDLDLEPKDDNKHETNHIWLWREKHTWSFIHPSIHPSVHFMSSMYVEVSVRCRWRTIIHLVDVLYCTVLYCTVPSHGWKSTKVR
jgi:hypothetical protein